MPSVSGRRLLSSFGLLFILSLAVGAASPRAATAGAPGEIILQLPAFGSFFSSSLFTVDPRYYVYAADAGDSEFIMPLTLPNGARITSYGLYYYDNNLPTVTGRAVAVLEELTGGDGITAPEAQSVGAATSEHIGYSVATAVLTPPLTINSRHQYYFKVVVPRSAGFKTVEVRYHLQMSPAPAKATFADVPPDYPYFRAIEALAGAGITAGCGNGNFCPDRAVTRGEVAKFLAVSLGVNPSE